ncbi:MAG: sodium:proton exchanger [Gammaproteobacteria bacterium CG22_combo_CG10-13_8_21_14_all_40_8]|nr:MAG: sodium:proton exchanger [Gammaproteobacteria bacterium CG22_combo_CG10-13_8_21_14_all_40_8]
MHLSPILPLLVGVLFVILFIGLLLRSFRQPQLVSYIIAGIVIGPFGLSLLSDAVVIDELGGFGVTLLLFFIGMEVSPQQLIKGWRIAIFGTLFQIMVSVFFTWLMGTILGWPFARSILLGFVISLSSTAVVLKLLQDRGELSSHEGQNVLLILLAQDLAVVPMMIIISLLGSHTPSSGDLMKQLLGGSALLLFSAWLLTRKKLNLPFVKHIKKNHELQVFAALLICFGMAFITGYLQLSAALGAFIGGMIVATAKETVWVHKALEPLHILFVAIFFVSIGLLIDPIFFKNNFKQIVTLVISVLVTNTFINAFILKGLGDKWTSALYSGALLSQIGEFSFVLAAMGLHSQIVTQHAYQMTISVISLSLLASPAWIALMQRILRNNVKPELTTERRAPQNSDRKLGD